MQPCVISRTAPLALAAVKTCIRAAGDTPLGAGLAVEREALWRLTGTPDWREGAEAFLEKRTPEFTGH